ncbi:MAG: HlyD family secretion protein [Bacteroidota bacterium]|nr:HlyD family secretion protein [Bacteroidota bacterium]
MAKINEQEEEKKGFKVYIPLIVVTILVLGGLWFWYRDYSRYTSTDDAYVDADKVAVSSKILGRITKLYVAEGDSVKQGMLIAEIDSTELNAQKSQTIALKEQSAAAVAQAMAKLNFDQESLKVLNVNLQKAKDDLTRSKAQFEGGVITKEQYEHAQKAHEAAVAQLNAATSQLSVSRTQITSAQKATESAQAQIGVISTQLRNTKLYAPFNGVVSKRWLLAGDIAQAGQSIFTVTNDRHLWVTVYLEETNLAETKIGQQAHFTVDAFPGVKFYGKVFYIGANTAAQFSLIPPSNASGNFTKTTQRVPVKISIDKAENNKGEKVSPRLISGMSVVMKLYKD